MTNTEMQAQALSNARNHDSTLNYEAVYNGFQDKGIPLDAITPRVNVFTFNAWKALGRVVRKGEHGVRVLTWVPVAAKFDAETGNKVADGFRRPKTTTVFHVSQTDAIATEG